MRGDKCMYSYCNRIVRAKYGRQCYHCARLSQAWSTSEKYRVYNSAKAEEWRKTCPGRHSYNERRSQLMRKLRRKYGMDAQEARQLSWQKFPAWVPPDTMAHAEFGADYDKRRV